MNIKDTIKNIKTHFRKKEVPENIPMTGGSIYTDISKLQTTEYLSTIDIKKVGTNYPINYDRTINYNVWMVLNFHCEYFANYFKLKCEDQSLLETVIKVFKGYFYFGNAGILFINNKLVPVYEIKSNFNNSGDLISVEVGYLNELFTKEFDQIYKPPNNIFTIKKDMLDNYIRIGGGTSAYIKWLPFVKLQTQVLNMCNDHRYFIHKNLGINVKDVSAFQKEMEIYFNLEVPFFINIGSTTNTNTNNFVDLGGVDAAHDKILTYYDQITKIYYELLGRRKNTDYKKERNITAEVNASQENFSVLLNNEKHFKELFLKKISEKTGIHISIINDTNVDDGENANEVDRMNQSNQ